MMLFRATKTREIEDKTQQRSITVMPHYHQSKLFTAPNQTYRNLDGSGVAHIMIGATINDRGNYKCIWKNRST